MIPKRIQPYFEVKQQTVRNDTCLVEGMLTCCDDHSFDVFGVGELKRSFFLKMFLAPKNDRTMIKACCKKCGKSILVFDSNCDGYEQNRKKTEDHAAPQPITCVKCGNRDFSVGIKYEYSNLQELKELEEQEAIQIDDAFSWIWITLCCNTCAAKYKYFSDYETA